MKNKLRSLGEIVAALVLVMIIITSALLFAQTQNWSIKYLHKVLVHKSARTTGPDLLQARFTNWRNIPMYRHKFIKSWNQRLREFWESITPTVSCKSQHLRRAGNPGDGGKWTCGVLQVGAFNKTKPCAVFSFGVNDDSSFETSILVYTFCKVFAYDPTVATIAKPLDSCNPRVTFKRLAVGGRNGSNMKTIKALMEENGYEWIEILKIDVEGYEYETLSTFLDDFPELPVGQLLVELHYDPDKPFYRSPTNRVDTSVLPLLEGLESRGLQLFHKEVNPGGPNCCWEFSFINTKVHKELVIQRLNQTV